MRTYASILRRLCSWQERLRTCTSEKPLYWTVPSSLFHPNQTSGSENIFPRVLEFRSINVAIPLLFSWAIRVQIFNNLIRIYSLIGRASTSIPSFRDIFKPPTSSTPENYDYATSTFTASDYDYTPSSNDEEGPSMIFSVSEADRLCTLICQGLEYFHKSRMGLLGPQCTTFPQWSIRHYFQHHPGHEREMKWCTEFKNLRGESSRCGIETMKFVDVGDE
jgi:hypothetical protein